MIASIPAHYSVAASSSDRIDLMTTLAMPREIVWRTISTLRKNLGCFGIDIAVCEHGYVLARYGEKEEDSG